MFGALEGFALAIVFARKCLWSLDRPSRRKHSNMPPSSSGGGSENADASNTEAYQQLLALKESDCIEATSPVELTLGQVVRKKLNSGCKTSIKTIIVLSHHRGIVPVTTEQGEELQKHTGAVYYIECSSNTQQNLKDVFDAAIKVIIQPPSKQHDKKKKKPQKCSKYVRLIQLNASKMKITSGKLDQWKMIVMIN